jgi:hypothetical protein
MGWLVRGSQLQVAKTRSGRHDSVRSRTQEALDPVVDRPKSAASHFCHPQETK